MFRPNRIGTPVIYESDATVTPATTAPNMSTFATPEYLGNIVNATVRGDFGQHALQWIPSAPQTLTANRKWWIGFQFTVTEPLQGDVTGVECNGAIAIRSVYTDTTVIPFIGRLTAPGITTLATGTVNHPQFLNNPNVASKEIAGVVAKDLSHSFQQQVIIKRTANVTLAGTYVLGHIFWMETGGTFTRIDTQYSVRQLNDQQTIGYRDTLR